MTQYEDKIMKQAWSTFARDGLKLFGITKKAVGMGPTELMELKITNKFMDGNYLFGDDTYGHFEFQSTNNNTADLKRFRVDESILSLQTGKEVVTYVLYSGNIKNPNSVLKCGINQYRVISISLAKIDGDANVEEVLKKVSEGTPLNHDDAVSVAFNAVMGGEKSQKEKILDTLNVAKHFNKNTKLNLRLFPMFLL